MKTGTVAKNSMALPAQNEQVKISSFRLQGSSQCSLGQFIEQANSARFAEIGVPVPGCQI